jgi:DNA-binding Xre family transcriptional regulator
MLRIKELAKERGIENPGQLLDNVKISSHAAYQLWENTAKRLDVKTLQKLATFFDVEIGDLFTRQRPAPTETRAAPRKPSGMVDRRS